MLENQVNRNWLSRLNRLLLPAEKLLLAYIFGFIAFCFVLSVVRGYGHRFFVFMYGANQIYAICSVLCCFLCARMAYVMVVHRPKHLFRFILNDFRTVVFTRERMLRSAVPAIGFMVFIGAFSSMKSLIPAFNPYCWDPTLYRLDHSLHGNNDPWRLLQPVLGQPLITYVVNFLYNIWGIMMIGVYLWQIFSLATPKIRMQYFYTFFMSWTINGVLFAMLFSSVGPCFYGGVVDGPDPYQPQMEYLHETTKQHQLWAVNMQQHLWHFHQKNETELGSGISAMPSMHVSIAFLIFLIGMRYSRWTAILFGAYALIVMIGSVHLAWHYAVDGYLAIATTWIIWLIAGRICDRVMPMASGTGEKTVV